PGQAQPHRLQLRLDPRHGHPPCPAARLAATPAGPKSRRDWTAAVRGRSTTAMHGFDHIHTWIFDLDNTLYPPEVRLFDQIQARMTDWVMATLGLDRAEADALRRHYW